MVDILETMMLIAFSLGWYYSIAKMLRTGKASGKSLGFVGLVCFGYLCGILSKVISFQQTGDLSAVVYVYAWNFLVTGFDGWLVIVLTRRERRDVPVPTAEARVDAAPDLALQGRG